GSVARRHRQVGDDVCGNAEAATGESDAEAGADTLGDEVRDTEVQLECRATAVEAHAAAGIVVRAELDGGTKGILSRRGTKTESYESQNRYKKFTHVIPPRNARRKD